MVGCGGGGGGDGGGGSGGDVDVFMVKVVVEVVVYWKGNSITAKYTHLHEPGCFGVPSTGLARS